MSSSRAVEVWRIIGILLLALIVGLLSRQLAWALVGGLAVILVWHYRQLWRVLRWVRVGKRSEPPDITGLWGDLVSDIYQLYQRNRKRKKKLAKLLNRFHQSTSAMPDATVVLGQSGEIEWFNDAAKRLLGLHAPQDVGRRIGNLIRHPIFTSFLAGGDYREPIEIPSPVNEHHVLNVRIVPYGNNKRLLSARDVTRLHKLEKMRRDFVGNVSHELRTPLTVISGYLEALTDGGEDDTEAVRASLLQMKGQAERMRRIVEDLLMLTRLETQETNGRHQTEVAVPGLLSALQEDARILSGDKHHQINLEADPELWLKGNPSELHSAFSNVISNAVRYTPAGGVINIRWYADEEGAHFEVQDTGIGVEPRHLSRLTERFYRVDMDRSRASGGTGLGLAIVKHVLQRHDAQLRVQSSPGEGSVFTCDFPHERVTRRKNEDEAATA